MPFLLRTMKLEQTILNAIEVDAEVLWLIQHFYLSSMPIRHSFHLQQDDLIVFRSTPDDEKTHSPEWCYAMITQVEPFDTKNLRQKKEKFDLVYFRVCETVTVDDLD
jgi:hypothetical protein